MKFNQAFFLLIITTYSCQINNSHFEKITSIRWVDDDYNYFLIENDSITLCSNFMLSPKKYPIEINNNVIHLELPPGLLCSSEGNCIVELVLIGNEDSLEVTLNELNGKFFGFGENLGDRIFFKNEKIYPMSESWDSLVFYRYAEFGDDVVLDSMKLTSSGEFICGSVTQNLKLKELDWWIGLNKEVKMIDADRFSMIGGKFEDAFEIEIIKYDGAEIIYHKGYFLPNYFENLRKLTSGKCVSWNIL